METAPPAEADGAVPVVGQCKPCRRLPSRGLRRPLASGAASPLRSPLAGLIRLSEFLSDRRSGSWVHRRLLAVSTTTRPSADRPARTRRPGRLPQAWTPSQGLLLGAGPAPADAELPLLGFRRPSSVLGTGIRFSRVCLTRHVPSSGFLTPPTGSSPRALRPRGPLPLLGFRWSAHRSRETKPPTRRHAVRYLARDAPRLESRTVLVRIQVAQVLRDEPDVSGVCGVTWSWLAIEIVSFGAVWT